jgi:hypothetical protein
MVQELIRKTAYSLHKPRFTTYQVLDAMKENRIREVPSVIAIAVYLSNGGYARKAGYVKIRTNQASGGSNAVVWELKEAEA